MMNRYIRNKQKFAISQHDIYVDSIELPYFQKLGCHSFQKATREQDIEEHWDWLAVKNGEIIKVDSKTLKPICAEDKTIIIELYTVQGKPGWAHGSATHFSFPNPYNPEKRLIIKSDVLRAFIIEKNLWNLPVAKRIDNAIYKLYSRPNRFDLIVKIPFNDLKHLHDINFGTCE